MKRIGFDSETTGVDLYHGAMPFLFSIADETDVTIWEWPVNPLTRQPIINKSDVKEIQARLDDADEIIIQNSKFDVRAAYLVGIRKWPWHKTVDTLIASHLLSSNTPHDLTTLGIQYLGINIERYEKAMELAVKTGRTLARRRFPKWRIAAKQVSPDTEEGLAELDMPSAKDKAWRYDMWLPRAIAEKEGYPANHLWRRVTKEYNATDSALLVPLWLEMKEQIEERKLGKIFYGVRNELPKIASRMEHRGITANAKRLTSLEKQYTEEVAELKTKCVNMASLEYNYDLSLPKSGNNNSLLHLCFGRTNEDGSREEWMKLPDTGVKTNTGNPSLSRKAIDFWLDHYPATSPEHCFFRWLLESRRRKTAVQYMQGYRRYWKTTAYPDYHVLHASLNPTGTFTLRWSSSNPNEQNISKQEGFNLRYIFGPAPGREWVSMDAKNIELRIPAYESGELELIDLFERPDEPPYYGSNHILIFETLHPDKWALGLKEAGFNGVGPWCKKKYASTWYQWTKNGNFAVQYGAIDREDGEGTADRAYHVRGAQKRIAARFKKLDTLNQHWISYARKNGYVETMPDKSIDPDRGYPLNCARTAGGGILPTVPLNYHVQGTAMWWMSRAMQRTEAKLSKWRSEGIDCHLIMQVHDELVFDFPKGVNNKKKYYDILKREMERGGEDIGVPTPVSIELHADNWSEGVTI